VVRLSLWEVGGPVLQRGERLCIQDDGPPGACFRLGETQGELLGEEVDLRPAQLLNLALPHSGMKDFCGVTKVEREHVYTTDEFLAAVRTLPVASRHEEQWAIDTARACANTTTGRSGKTFLYDQPTVEVGVSEDGDRIVWHIYFPERSPRPSDSGLAFAADEGTGACKQAMLGG
jgi:hypothetical protein